MHTAVRDIFWAKTWSRRAITGHDSTVQAYSVVEHVNIPSSAPHIRDLAYTVQDTAPRHFILQLSPVKDRPVQGRYLNIFEKGLLYLHLEDKLDFW